LGVVAAIIPSAASHSHPAQLPPVPARVKVISADVGNGCACAGGMTVNPNKAAAIVARPVAMPIRRLLFVAVAALNQFKTAATSPGTPENRSTFNFSKSHTWRRCTRPEFLLEVRCHAGFIVLYLISSGTKFGGFKTVTILTLLCKTDDRPIAPANVSPWPLASP
jgi:hypothetical protein